MPRRDYSARPIRPDDENPEWTAQDFARARPAREVLPDAVLEAFAKARGRPKAVITKLPVNLRIDARVLGAYKATGKGWQTRMNEVLAAAVPRLPVAGETADKAPKREKAAR